MKSAVYITCIIIIVLSFGLNNSQNRANVKRIEMMSYERITSVMSKDLTDYLLSHYNQARIPNVLESMLKARYSYNWIQHLSILIDDDIILVVDGNKNPSDVPDAKKFKINFKDKTATVIFYVKEGTQ